MNTKQKIIIGLILAIMMMAYVIASMDISNTKVESVDGSDKVELSAYNLTYGTAPLLIGAASANPIILLKGWYKTADSNGHGFVDQSVLDASNQSYASFDAYAYINGSGNRDHYNGYQVRSYYSSPSTITSFRGYNSNLNIDQGTVNNAYHYFTNGINVYGGAVVNEYGLYMGNIDAGSNLNYAIYTNDGDVRFGDNVNIANSNLTVGGDSFCVDSSNDRVGIGTCSLDRNLNIDGGGSNANVHIYNTASGGTTTDGFDIVFLGANTHLRNREAGTLELYTNNLAAVVIDSSQDVTFNQEVAVTDTNTGGNPGSDLCIGADNKICICGSCA